MKGEAKGKGNPRGQAHHRVLGERESGIWGSNGKFANPAALVELISGAGGRAQETMTRSIKKS